MSRPQAIVWREISFVQTGSILLSDLDLIAPGDNMKNILLYLVALAGCVVVSAQLGMADRKKPADRPLSSHRETAPAATGDTAVFEEATRRRGVIQTTRSLLPLTAPRSVARPEPAVQTLRGEIIVLPLGNLTKSHLAAAGHVADAAAAFYALPAQQAQAVALDSIPEACFVQQDGVWQLRPDALLDAVAESMPTRNIAAVLAVTEFQLQNVPSGHVARQIAPGQAAAVLSLPGGTDGDSIRLTLKMALLSLNKGLGAMDCQTDSCLMNSGGGESELREQPLILCPDCLASLAIATGVTAEQHSTNMLELCKKKGFNSEARHYLRTSQLLK